MRAWQAGRVVLGAMLAGLGVAGCGSMELPPCDAPERRAQAHQVATMPPGVRDSIVQAFEGRSRIQQVRLVQNDCHLRATVQIDSFTTHRYATSEAIELMRVLKENAPNESHPVQDRVPGEIGAGIYDYSVDVVEKGPAQRQEPSEQEGEPWVRVIKSYDDLRVSVMR